jgi:peptide/nickel transport system substrate-binding protein
MSDEVQGHLTRADLFRRAAAGGAVIITSGTLGEAAQAAHRGLEATKPKKGGTFRIGVSGGSTKDFIDGQNIVTRPDQARIVTGWETLVTFNPQFKLAFDGLAEEISHNKAGDVWTIRVHKGIEFHNGKTLTADDVAYSLKRLIDPKLGLFGGAALKSVDPNRMKKLDKYTVRLTLKQKDGTILDALGQYIAGIVPVGYSPTAVGKASPNIGTGPYKLKSFTPGQQSVHVRNPNYWRSGQPYFDQVIIIDFPDDTARVNALLGGQIDAMTDVPPAQVNVVNQSRTKVLESPSAAWTPICMRVDAAPFDDVKVRQAFRLIADRPQMVQQALSGHGHVGNDLYGIFDESFASDLPQRKQDIAKAKSLLKAAGKENLTVDLQTTNGALGMNEGAQVFAQQAKAAGVTVNVKILDSGTFYGDQYLKWPLSTDFWGSRNYLSQVAAGSLPTSPYNETHWPAAADQKFLSLYNQALQTVDRKKQKAVMHEMQKMEYDDGGYIIWGFSTLLDGYSTKVKGLKTGDKGVLPFNAFGHGYRTIWFG